MAITSSLPRCGSSSPSPVWGSHFTGSGLGNSLFSTWPSPSSPSHSGWSSTSSTVYCPSLCFRPSFSRSGSTSCHSPSWPSCPEYSWLPYYTFLPPFPLGCYPPTTSSRSYCLWSWKSVTSSPSVCPTCQCSPRCTSCCRSSGLYPWPDRSYSMASPTHLWIASSLTICS